MDWHQEVVFQLGRCCTRRGRRSVNVFERKENDVLIFSI